MNALREFWKLTLVTTRYALTARFSVIAGLVAAIALLTVEQGREMLRAMAEPRAQSVAPNLAGLPVIPQWNAWEWHHLGWFSFATILLSLACWASTRLCYGLIHETESGENLELEKLMERKLPMYFGALPLVVAGCGFLQEAFTYLRKDAQPGVVPFIVWAASLLLLFGVPSLVIARWLFLHGDENRLARSGPGLRYILFPCAALPVLACIFLYYVNRHQLGGFEITLSTLFAAEYFFLLAIGIYHFEKPWIIALPGGGLLFIAFCFRVWETHDFWNVVAAGVAHLLLSLAIWRIAIGGMQTLLNLSDQLNFGQVMRTIFFLSSDPIAPPVGSVERTTLRAAGLVSVILVGMLAAIWGNPQWIPRWVGPAAVLSLALTAWVVVGNGLIVATKAARLPLITFAFLWILLCSICEENHVVRLSPVTKAAGDAAGFSKPYKDIDTLFREWYARVGACYEVRDSKQKRPCFIIATEGGGIRAAFWTAQVLTRLEDESRKKGAIDGSPNFASHVLAISGVSGGSLGAAVFEALYAESKDPDIVGPTPEERPKEAQDLGKQAARILGDDHLSPLVGAMLFPDAVQRFIPGTLPGTDRGGALERSWEDRWKIYVSGTHKNRFSEPFLHLWDHHLKVTEPWAPALFLNSTRVEDGRRIIASNVSINSGPKGDFPGALDLHDYLWPESNVVHWPWQHWRQTVYHSEPAKRRDLPLSSAVHCSARFTYFSPAGRLPSGHRVVDGGYYEDSGGETARNILDVVDKALHDDPTLHVQPILVLIRYIEHEDPKQDEFEPIAPVGTDATVEAYALSDLISPMLALANVRDAHATDEYAAFGRLWASPPELQWHAAYPFQLVQRRIPLPLGWMVSGRAATEMVTEMPIVGDDPAHYTSSSITLTRNHAHLLDVLECLGRENTKKKPAKGESPSIGDQN